VVNKIKKISEIETIIKRIVPYLTRRGYNLEKDLKFGEAADFDENRKGFIDIMVTCGRQVPYFIIEAKRDGTKIISKHLRQAIEYGQSKKCLFVVVTNGLYFELLNTQNKKPLHLNGASFNRIPTRTDLIERVIPQLKSNPGIENIVIPSDRALPFRPGLPLSKLNHLIKKCHNSIRKIEKNEESAFSDFSKILFLKLLEEKWDAEHQKPLYTYCFHELASLPRERAADQIQAAIKAMIQTIKDKTKYGEALNDPIKLKKDATYMTIVKRLSSVSFIDCDLDAKGAVFEHFVRATLKGKKLGQYFTPRPLVKLMLHLGHYRQILSNLKAGLPFKVLDPACGTGGFLVYAMNLCIREVEVELKRNKIHKSLAETLIKQIKEDTFYGIDAFEGVASSAKMNMIIAGDGHNNIKCADSLKENRLIPWYVDNKSNVHNDGKAHLILTNPPFGTSEAESLSPDDLEPYESKSTKGQSLFIQKMIFSVHPGGRIVTVIDEGVLNTCSYTELRALILKECRIEFIVSLPEETFKPNKINVKSSVLVLQKRTDRDENLQDMYPIGFVKIGSLGYEGSGEEIKSFDLDRLIREINQVAAAKLSSSKLFYGYKWYGFKVASSEIIKDRTKRLDIKYWDVLTRGRLTELMSGKSYKKIRDINVIKTRRGISPPAAEYVSEREGFALVVKAGTNISKTGELITKGDYIEEAYFREHYKKDMILKDGDILLASTGDGTLGKCCVYRNKDADRKDKPAIADGHVTVIRVQSTEFFPEFLCDYFRKGFGAEQLNRLYTGSTGLIEIQPDDVDEIIIPSFLSIKEQKKISKFLRKNEQLTHRKVREFNDRLVQTEKRFFQSTFIPG
jgi:type I restriction enzyme M protein